METPYRTDIQVRFADTDALGHLNNTAYSFYAEHARLEFFSDLGAEVAGLILARIALDFRRQVRFREDVYVLTRVERVGNSSVTLAQEVYATEELAAEASSVVVLFNYEAGRSKRIPEELRGRLEAHLTSSNTNADANAAPPAEAE